MRIPALYSQRSTGLQATTQRAIPQAPSRIAPRLSGGNVQSASAGDLIHPDVGIDGADEPEIVRSTLLCLRHHYAIVVGQRTPMIPQLIMSSLSDLSRTFSRGTLTRAWFSSLLPANVGGVRPSSAPPPLAEDAVR